MALYQYRIRRFDGISQGVAENALDPSESPDACNMDTALGNLAVAKGYVRHSDAAFPTPNDSKRLFVWNRADGQRMLLATGEKLYLLDEATQTWNVLYTFANGGADAAQYDFQQLKLGSTEYLVIANGLSQMAKWNGTDAAAAFGSAAGLSDLPVNFIELYFNRLFAAGNPAFPCRLYWSKAPGDTRTLEDWSSADESENVSGGHVEVGTDSDPITGLVALSNQLLIFKRDSLYRLLGDRPANYRICPVNAAMRQPVHTAMARYGDALYFLTDGGMYYYDGQTVHRLQNADKVRAFLNAADLTMTQAAACKDKLYFAVKEHGSSPCNDALLVYDPGQGSYMVRRGFLVRGLYAVAGVLYIIDGNGRVCRFNEGETYDGVRIEAYWKTPLTDLDNKIADKRLQELYLRGTGGLLSVEAVADGKTVWYDRIMPGSGGILEAPLTGDGRAFSLRFANVNGSHFAIDGGVELLLDLQRRVL